MQTNPTFRELWTVLADGAIGRVHSARALYGTAGSTWATWFHDAGIGPLPDIGIYNLRSLTALLGPVVETYAADVTAVPQRVAAGITIEHPDPDTVHVLLRHASGALSSIVSSHAIQHYRRPALELYGTKARRTCSATTGIQRVRALAERCGAWTLYEAVDATWLWTDGLRELVHAIRDGTASVLLRELGPASRRRSSSRRGRRSPSTVRSGSTSTFTLPELRLVRTLDLHHLHDHTRSPDEQ